MYFIFIIFTYLSNIYFFSGNHKHTLKSSAVVTTHRPSYPLLSKGIIYSFGKRGKDATNITESSFQILLPYFVNIFAYSQNTH